MKKYTGTKTVQAEPMMLGKFIEIEERNPYKNDPLEHFYDEDGYYVCYEDGYKSWCPKNVFEKAYRPSDTYAERMMLEKESLNDRLIKANSFIGTAEFASLSEREQYLFKTQTSAMEAYLHVLKERIEIYKMH